MEYGKSLARICGWSSWPPRWSENKRKKKKTNKINKNKSRWTRHISHGVPEEVSFGFLRPFVSTTTWASRPVWIAAIRAVPNSSSRTWSRPTARQIHLCDSHVRGKLPLSWWTARLCDHPSVNGWTVTVAWAAQKKTKKTPSGYHKSNFIHLFSFFLFLTVSHPIPIPSISHSFILCLSKQLGVRCVE